MTSLLAFAALSTTPKITQPSPRRLALIIGVKDYKGTGYEDLNGDKDAKLISAAITARWGFKAADVTSLSGKVTKADIAKAFSTLTTKAAAGDLIYVHYSGHGTQIKDEPSGPLHDESDGWDECLVPSGGNDKDRKTLVTDDEINVLLEGLRKKKVGSVAFTLDSCHSGGASRGRAKPRGRTNPEATASRGDGTQGTDFEDGQFSNFTFLAAAQANEQAWELDGGIFTQAFVKALSTIPIGSTWKELHARVYDGVMEGNNDERQTPVLEGDDSRLLFENKTNAGAITYPVRTSFDELRIAGGQVHGLTAGSQIEFQAVVAGSTTPKTFRGTLKDVRLAESTFILDPATPQKDISKLSGALAKVVAPANPTSFLKLRIPNGSTTLASELAAIKSIEASTTQDKADLSITKAGTNWQLRGPADELIREIPDGPTANSALKDAVNRHAKWKLVKELGASDCDVKVEMEIQKVEAMADPSGRKLANGQPLPVFKSAASPGGPVPQFKSTEYFAIRIRAQAAGGGPGSWDPFIGILNLMNSGEIKQVWPSPTRASNEDSWKLSSDGDWYWLQKTSGFIPAKSSAEDLQNVQLFTVDSKTDGKGDQIFKLMATKVAVKYAPLLQPGTSRGSTPLEVMLNSFATGQSRGEALEPQPGEWMSKNYYVRATE